MRFIPWLVGAAIIFSSCASTESSTNTESSSEGSQTERVDKTAPDWFDSSIRSKSDSTAFYGYAHAVAADRVEAQELSEESATANLRFEIDRFVEMVRENLEEETGSETYSSSHFIMGLRNTVQGLSLENADSETDFHERDGIFDAYSEVSIPLEDVIEMISEKISDTEFTSAIKNGMDN